MKYIALVAALSLAGCCGTNNAPALTPVSVTPGPAPAAAAPVKSPCAGAAATASAPFGCNSNAKASTASSGCNANAKATGRGPSMSHLTMPTPAAKALAVPPNVVVCIFNFVKCLVDTLVSPLVP